MSDLLVFIPKGLVLHWECKSTDGKLEEEQLLWKEELEALGHKYYVIRSSDDAINSLKENGITPIWSLG